MTEQTELYGFIGCGNMGGALAAAASKVLGGAALLLSDRDADRAFFLANTLGASSCGVEETARRAQTVFLGVKPQGMSGLLEMIGPILREREDRFILVSMAAGVTISRIRELLGAPYPVIRIMPNTPVSVGAGMILYDFADVTEDEVRTFTSHMSGAGTFDRLEESLIDAGSAISGCGPAFVDLFLEAFADGGVECGLSREKALLYAAQTLLGTAKLSMDTQTHPGVLKDHVCSPGGSTIAGVHALERSAFRGAVMDAVSAAFEKTKALGK